MPEGSDTLDDTSRSQGSSANGGSYAVVAAINDLINENSEESDENGRPILTQAVLKRMLKKKQNGYYQSMDLNEVLHLHKQGYKNLRNMELFPNLKCLYFDGNGKLHIPNFKF